ncbi:hypothetical protein G5714_006521 [Onychostoma macrolepis]|uniref:BESS domain-containing protein n=1 Tax=Onychostoma macrolepis TaxID=369639 RepID=A0A7J6D428_9TELE|nr:hypothetical protein G5714_006521 [Onychostoma macrolepis]
MAVTEKLIQSVHAYPVLYNVSLHDYRSAERRVKAWRRSPRPSVSPVTGRLSGRVQRRRLKPGLDTATELESKRPLKAAPLNPLSIAKPVTQLLLTGLPPGLKLPQPPAPAVTSDLDGKTEKDKEKAFDEDELFLLSYVPALKRLTPQKRAAVKMQIQQIMFDAEFKEQL